MHFAPGRSKIEKNAIKSTIKSIALPLVIIGNKTGLVLVDSVFTWDPFRGYTIAAAGKDELGFVEIDKFCKSMESRLQEVLDEFTLALDQYKHWLEPSIRQLKFNKIIKSAIAMGLEPHLTDDLKEFIMLLQLGVTKPGEML